MTDYLDIQGSWGSGPVASLSRIALSLTPHVDKYHHILQVPSC